MDNVTIIIIIISIILVIIICIKCITISKYIKQQLINLLNKLYGNVYTNLDDLSKEYQITKAGHS